MKGPIFNEMSITVVKSYQIIKNDNVANVETLNNKIEWKVYYYKGNEYII